MPEGFPTPNTPEEPVIPLERTIDNPASIGHVAITPEATSATAETTGANSPATSSRASPGFSLNQWAAKGACISSDPDALFVQGAAQNRAKAVCLTCPVRVECLSDALDHKIEFGVWGGMTERERRALLRRRPNVQSWRSLLETARGEHLRLIDLLDPPANPSQG